MAVKDSLRIILVANNSQVAISTDPALWQSVYSAIHDDTHNQGISERNKVTNKSVTGKPGKWIPQNRS